MKNEQLNERALMSRTAWQKQYQQTYIDNCETKNCPVTCFILNALLFMTKVNIV